MVQSIKAPSFLNTILTPFVEHAWRVMPATKLNETASVTRTANAWAGIAMYFKGLVGKGFMMKFNVFSKRLKQAMGSETNYAFAKRSGISEPLLRKYLTGVSIPSMEKAMGNGGRSERFA
ncbi:hypothetical protein [Pseudomonas proteolytica]|uniref:hypothetical protein n=1 Tax=Pseudomonas proteolytica TaxID=219574 RepID=UPI003207D688